MHSLDDTIAAIASPPGGAASHRAPQRAGLASHAGRLLSPHAVCRLGVDCASHGGAGIVLAPRRCRAAARRIVFVAGIAELHGPGGRRGPRARFAAASGGPAAHPSARPGAACRARRIHATGLSGRSHRHDAGRGGPGRDRRRRSTAVAHGAVQLAGGLARPSTGFATVWWTCWPSSKPGSISPRRT